MNFDAFAEDEQLDAPHAFSDLVEPGAGQASVQTSAKAPDPTPVREGKTRDRYIPSGLERCLSCASRSINRDVVYTKTGRPTALCRLHADYEIDLLKELADAAKLGPVSPEKWKDIRKAVRERHAPRFVNLSLPNT